MLIHLELPYPPSVNRYWRHNRGRTHLSQAGREYRDAVRYRVLSSRPRLKAITGELSMMINIYPPDRRRRDIDNTLKALCDSLQHAGVYKDDYQIGHLTITREDVTPDGRCVITLTTRNRRHGRMSNENS